MSVKQITPLVSDKLRRSAVRQRSTITAQRAQYRLVNSGRRRGIGMDVVDAVASSEA
jgi:hypothetical protein